MPLDYSNIKDILRDNCVYIDKTRYAYRLITGMRRCFISRPRRFGKSLFVSTLEEILKDNKELFKNLWIGSSDYHWEPLAVIKLDFSQLEHATPKLFLADLIDDLIAVAQNFGINLDVPRASITAAAKKLFSELVKRNKKQQF